MNNLIKNIFFTFSQIKLNTFSFFFVFFILFFSLTSCSDSLPNGHEVTSKIIFDYENTREKPICKLSFFIRMISDVRRIEYINLFHSESEQRWIIQYPMITKFNNDFYAGYTNCQASYQNENKIPEGQYSVLYIDSKGEQFFSSFNLNYSDYPTSLYSDEFRKKISSDSCSIYIGLYSQDDNLLYYDKPLKKWNISTDFSIYNEKEIFKFNSSAYYFRLFYEFKDAVYIMPKVEKK